MVTQSADHVSITVETGEAEGGAVVEVPRAPQVIPLRIAVQAEGKSRLLLGEDEEVAPDELTLQRSGDDLLVMFDGVGPEQAQLLVEGVYQEGASEDPPVLAGLAEDGIYRPYVNSAVPETLYLAQLSPGAMTVQALGHLPLSVSPVAAGWSAALATSTVAGGAAAAYQGMLSGASGGPGPTTNPGPAPGPDPDPGPVKPMLTLSGMGKNSGAAGDYLTNDGGAGRVLHGTLGGPLAAGAVVQVSTDGGRVWQDAMVTGTNWHAIDMNVHAQSWQVQMRIADAGGGFSGANSQEITLDRQAPTAPKAVTRNGDEVTVDISGAGGAVGDSVRLSVGAQLIIKTLTAADVSAGTVRMQLPPALAAVSTDFPLGAALIDRAGNISAYRTSALGFEDFNVPIYTRVDGKLAALNLNPTTHIAFFIEDLRLSPGGRVEFSLHSDNFRALQTGRSMRIQMAAGATSYLEVGVAPIDKPMRVTFYNAKGVLLHTQVQTEIFTIRPVSFKAPAGEGISYVTLEPLGGPTDSDYYVKNISYIVDNKSKTVNFEQATSIRSASGEILNGAQLTANSMFIGGMQISSSGRMASVSAAEALDSPTGGYLALQQLTATTFIPQGLSRTVSFHAAFGGNSNKIRFYNAAHSVIGVIDDLPATNNFGDPAAPMRLVTFSAATGQEIAYFIVDSGGGKGVRIDNISHLTATNLSTSPGTEGYRPSSSGGSYFGTESADIFELDALSRLIEGKVAIHGGGGIDTLRVSSHDGGGHDLSVAVRAGKITSVEVIEMVKISSVSSNKLTLSLGDVLELGGVDLFVPDGRVQFMVKGSEGDTVALSNVLGEGAAVGSWRAKQSPVELHGVAYQVYEHSLGQAELLVSSNLSITFL